MLTEESQQSAPTGRGEQMLTVNEVARLLRVHPNSVRRWANQGLIRAYRIGVRGDRRFRPDDVDRFLESWEPSRHPTPNSTPLHTRP
ncbi:MAG: helix-turn-helix domain-containing protein [Dehalococcoidia bacterium]